MVVVSSMRRRAAAEACCCGGVLRQRRATTRASEGGCDAQALNSWRGGWRALAAGEGQRESWRKFSSSLFCQVVAYKTVVDASVHFGQSGITVRAAAGV